MGYIEVSQQRLCSVERFIETGMLTGALMPIKRKILSTHFYIFVIANDKNSPNSFLYIFATSNWENILKTISMVKPFC